MLGTRDVGGKGTTMNTQTARVLGSLLLALTLALAACADTGNGTATTGGGPDTGPPTTEPSPDEPQEEAAELFEATVDPEETEGPYPAVEPRDKDPNPGEEFPPIPDGPLVGDVAPVNDPTLPEEAILPSDGSQAVSFEEYEELDNSQPSTSLCCPEVSVAENGQTVMTTGNFWVALSLDGGATFNNANPTTIFPEVDGGFCCDQVIHYVPEIDMFVWLMQYWPNGGGNRLRLAAQTTQGVRNSNGTSWTYWDFVSSVFTEGSLDYNDVAIGDSSLWFSTSAGGASNRVVARIPLSQIAARSTINYSYTGATDAIFSHVSQNGRDTVYWGGHRSNSEIRIYSMRDGDGFYSWRSVTVNSWPNGNNSSGCPDDTDWLAFDATKHYIYGNVVRGGDLWLGWLAAAGGGFPQAHVQLARINTSSWTLQEQVQIWNPDFAFGYPYLSTNAEGEIGMSVGFGGGDFFASHAVGVWGDFVVYYPRLSTRCTTRWGDYNTSRRAASDTLDWAAGGYTNESGTGGNFALAHYILFSR